MKQYIDWVDPALTVTDFYTNDTIKVGWGRATPLAVEQVPASNLYMCDPAKHSMVFQQTGKVLHPIQVWHACSVR